MPDFDLVALRYALRTFEVGSFRKVAADAGVRPSVVSRRVRAFEDAIGVGLFQRRSQGAEPTLAGKRLLSRASQIESEVDAFLRSAGQSGSGSEGELRFGVVASVASGFARALLAAFSESHPRLSFGVFEGASREHIAAVRALRLDFTFVTGIPLSSGCEFEQRWNERIYVAMPLTHALADDCRIAWELLADERFIVSRVDPGPEIQDFIIRGLADLGRHPNVRQMSVQRETLLALVGLGQGLSLVGEAEAGVSYPGVVFRPLEGEELPFSIVWSAQNDNPAFRRFLSAARVQALERRAALRLT